MSDYHFRVRDKLFNRLEDLFNTPFTPECPSRYSPAGSLLFWGSGNAIVAGGMIENVFGCFDPVQIVAASFGHELLKSGLCFCLL